MPGKQLSIWKTKLVELKLKQIYTYSFMTWGAQKARVYLKEIERTIQSVARGEIPTKINHEFSSRFSYCMSGKHYIFFEFKGEKLIVVNIFHKMRQVSERMTEESDKIEKEIANFFV